MYYFVAARYDLGDGARQDVREQAGQVALVRLGMRAGMEGGGLLRKRARPRMQVHWQGLVGKSGRK